MADATAARDYASVIREFMGRWGDWMAFAATLVFLPPVDCVAFAVEVVPEVFTSVSPIVACSAAIVVAAPLACMTSLERLSKASAFALMAILYAVVVTMVQGFIEGRHTPAAFAMTQRNLYFIIVAESIAAFGGEVAVIELYLETAKEKRKNFVRWVVDASLEPPSSRRTPS